VKILIELFDGYALKRKIVAYVKNEGFNLNFMTIALKLVVSCDVLGLEEVFRILVLVMHFKKCVNMFQ
jgi:hypothetical protein